MFIGILGSCTFENEEANVFNIIIKKNMILNDVDKCVKKKIYLSLNYGIP